jgi:hypothetical protein
MSPWSTKVQNILVQELNSHFPDTKIPDNEFLDQLVEETGKDKSQIKKWWARNYASKEDKKYISELESVLRAMSAMMTAQE